MCKQESASEQQANGYANVDSVVIQANIHDNCTCTVSIKDAINTFQLYILPYNSLPSSSPNTSLCGLQIDISILNAEGPSSITTVGKMACEIGKDRKSIAFLKNDRLAFKSTIIDGNFTRGYCIQIEKGNIKIHYPKYGQ